MTISDDYLPILEHIAEAQERLATATAVEAAALSDLAIAQHRLVEETHIANLIALAHTPPLSRGTHRRHRAFITAANRLGVEL
jgi:hypothetical protein